MSPLLRTRVAFVNVVAKVNDQVGIVVDHVAVGSVVSALIVLTRSERKAKSIRRGVDHRHRSRPSDNAFLVARVEAVPVPSIGFESFELHVNGMRPIRGGERGAGLYHVRHALVGRDLPIDENR